MWLRYYPCAGNSQRQNCCILHFVQCTIKHTKTQKTSKQFVRRLSEFIVMTHYFCDQDVISWYHARCSHVLESAGLENILSEFADTPFLDNKPLCVTYRCDHTDTDTSHVLAALHSDVTWYMRKIDPIFRPWKLQFYNICVLIVEENSYTIGIGMAGY